MIFPKEGNWSVFNVIALWSVCSVNNTFFLQVVEKYRSDIMKQIKEKQLEKIKEKQRRYEEGVALKIEEVQRERYIKEVMKKKVEELR